MKIFPKLFLKAFIAPIEYILITHEFISCICCLFKFEIWEDVDRGLTHNVHTCNTINDIPTFIIP